MEEFSFQALKKAYEQLTDQQKITFILAGGAPQLLSHQQRTFQRRQQEKRGKASSRRMTGDLPILV